MKILILFALLAVWPVWAGKGVIEGNGGSDLQLTQIELPDREVVDAALARLAAAEPSLVGLMRKSLGGEQSLTFLRADGQCRASVEQQERSRAVIDTRQRLLVFCDDYYRLNEDRRVATVFHELLHLVIREVSGKEEPGEERLVLLAEGLFLRFLTGDPDEERETLTLLRRWLDRALPELLLADRPELAPEALELLPLFSDPDLAVQYPVPREVLAKPAPHFLDYELDDRWCSDASLGSAALPLDRLTPCPAGHPVFSEAFTFHYREALRKQVRRKGEAPMGVGVRAKAKDRVTILKAERSKSPAKGFKAFCLSHDQVSSKFLAAKSDGRLPSLYLRTIPKLGYTATPRESSIVLVLP